MNLYFIKTLKLHDILKSFSVLLSVKNYILKLNVEHGVKFEMQILTLIPCGSCSPCNAEFALHRVAKKRTKNYNVHVQRLYYPLPDVPIAVAALVFFNSLINSQLGYIVMLHRIDHVFHNTVCVGKGTALA